MAVKIDDGLPLVISSLDELRRAADGEGVKNVSKLIQEWNFGQTMFDQRGEYLCMAREEGLVVGIGGLLVCKVVPDALRVSRFYVHPEWRRKGVAAAIANKALTHAWKFTRVVTCNAHASPIASPFWESLGFNSWHVPGITHVLEAR